MSVYTSLLFRFRLPAVMLAFPLLLAMGGNVAGAARSLEEANAILEQAHLAFERGEAERARDLYAQVGRSNYTAPYVWFNAGTAAYRAGDNGRAVLYYARALRLDPGHDLARQSLEVASPATNDAGTGLLGLLGQLLHRTTALPWVIAGQILFLTLCYSAAKTLAVSDPERRGHWLAVLLWTLFFTAAVFFAGWAAHQGSFLRGDAVVLEDGTVTRSEPRPDATAVLELPAGTLVRFREVQPRQGFIRVELLDGRGGFVPADSLERI